MTTFLDILAKAAPVLAAFLSPFFAVWVQSKLEGRKEKRKRKVDLFERLMATREDRLSLEHVKSLNMIEITFDSSVKKEKQIIDAWRYYHDHMTNRINPNNAPEATQIQWRNEHDNRFVSLLHTMAEALGYSFNKVDIQNHAYSPQGHVDEQKLLLGIKIGLRKLLDGESCLKTETIISHSPDDAEHVIKMKSALAKFVMGETKFPVTLVNDGDYTVQDK